MVSELQNAVERHEIRARKQSPVAQSHRIIIGHKSCPKKAKNIELIQLLALLMTLFLALFCLGKWNIIAYGAVLKLWVSVERHTAKFLAPEQKSYHRKKSWEKNSTKWIEWEKKGKAKWKLIFHWGEWKSLKSARRAIVVRRCRWFW